MCSLEASSLNLYLYQNNSLYCTSVFSGLMKYVFVWICLPTSMHMSIGVVIICGNNSIVTQSYFLLSPDPSMNPTQVKEEKKVSKWWEITSLSHYFNSFTLTKKGIHSGLHACKTWNCSRSKETVIYGLRVKMYCIQISTPFPCFEVSSTVMQLPPFGWNHSYVS